MQTENLIVKDEGAVTRITLNRPEKRNALSLELMSELIPALRGVTTPVVVIEGAGPCLSAGHDLSEMTDRPLAFYQELFTVCTELMETIQGIPQPVIAKVHGFATAAGCQLVAACDLAVAAEGAWFATPGVKIGLFCSTPMVEVSRAVGRKRAMEMLLTGTPIDTATAADWGLVNRVVPAEQLEENVADLAGKIAAVQPAGARHRQAGLLPPDRPRQAPGLRPHQGGHDDERHDRRRPGGHLRLPREAHADLEGRIGVALPDSHCSATSPTSSRSSSTPSPTGRRSSSATGA